MINIVKLFGTLTTCGAGALCYHYVLNNTPISFKSVGLLALILFMGIGLVHISFCLEGK